MIPTKNQLLSNFLSCKDWEEKYIYIMELGQLLPKFPDIFRTNRYLISGCQSYTWIVLTKKVINNNIKLYGDSDSAIIKGVIVIIFSLYQHLDIKSVITFNAKPFLDQLKLTQNLTVTRSQGVRSILQAIYNQANNILLNPNNTNEILLN